MGDLSELSLQTSYHKGRDDIARDFYLPCMQRATEYDRAVGYFRSTIFIIAWPALQAFVERTGRIRVLCSQVLAREDIEALEAGYAARVDEALTKRLREEVRGLLKDEVLREPARLLAALVANGTIELKVAILRETETGLAGGRLFHDKVGVFRDDSGHSVMFKGSMNETWSGLAADGNLESIDVAVSWLGSRDLERARTEEGYFDQLWEDRYPGVKVRDFPDVAREELEQAANPDWEVDLERLIADGSDGAVGDGDSRTLYPHQAAGLASWGANDRRGILEFATGSGKTFTAISAIKEAIVERAEVPVVVVPSKDLFTQWYEELDSTLSPLGVTILRAGAGYNRWKSSLHAWTAPGGERRVVLTTVQTARGDSFLDSLTGGDHLMLVADEVHRLGAPVNRRVMKPGAFGPRLGLSATPVRAGDPVGTAAIIDYFGGILEPRYTLLDAVRDRVLTPYFYRPHTVRLDEAEMQEWKDQTKRIVQIHAQRERGGVDEDLATRLRALLIKRAKIVKQASAKVPLAVEVMKQEYEPGQRWIVYCDSLPQLQTVTRHLQEQGIRGLPYHSKMTGDREQTLRWVEERGGILVAIRCLDEGVDIPSVTHALILASSKNPREFIQRRGRVLRKAPGKALAYVHDAIVVPPEPDPGQDRVPDPITEGELARAVMFAEGAENAAAAADLQQIAIDAGIDWRQLINEGVEDEED